MPESKYSAAFNAAALMHPEHLRMKDMLLSPGFEAQISREVEENRILSIKTRSARQRTVQEVRKRVAAAPDGFWEWFFGRSEAEQRLALFYLCLKTYPLVMDYHVEVAIKKWRSKALALDAFDLQMRLDEIASLDSTVDEWSESTKRKTITNYIRMLREAGMLKGGLLVKPPDIGQDFWQYFMLKGEGWFVEACFHA